LDSDHKQCFAHYKLVKKVAKAMTDMNSALAGEDFETCVSEAKKVEFVNAKFYAYLTHGIFFTGFEE
jgi:hypothetical protein